MTVHFEKLEILNPRKDNSFIKVEELQFKCWIKEQKN